MFSNLLKIRAFSFAVLGIQLLRGQSLCFLTVSLFAQSAQSQESPGQAAEAPAAEGKSAEPESETAAPVAAPENSAADTTPQTASPPTAFPESNSVDPGPETAAAAIATPETPAAVQTPQSSTAAAPSVRSYNCVRLPTFARSGTVQIDGRITESVWDLASWSEDFMDIEGSTRPRPMFRTRMKMLWDARALYIAAELQEPDVRGSVRGRDSVVFHDNDFEVFIDPDGDGLNYGELEINALNTVWDLRLPRPYSGGGQADDGWSLQGLRTAVQVDGSLNDPRTADSGWSVEMEIPWAGLQSLHATSQPIRRAVRDGSKIRGYEVLTKEQSETGAPSSVAVAPLNVPAEGDIWRMNFSRVQWPVESAGLKYRTPAGAREDNWVWSPQGVVDMHRPATWGRVMFVGSPESANAGRGPVRIIRR